MIEVLDIGKRYIDNNSRNISIEKINFNLNSKSILGVFGDKKSGRITLIKMLAGIVKPNSGSIIVDGLDLCDEKVTIKNLVGYVPKLFGDFDNLKVSEYLEYYAGLYKIDKKERIKKIKDAILTVKIDQYKDSFIDELTKEQMRVLSLASVLINNPKILILDDFFRNLDNNFKVNLYKLIISLKELGKIIIISSSEFNEIKDVCTHKCIIKEGKQIFFGDINDIIDDTNEIYEETTDLSNDGINITKETKDITDDITTKTLNLRNNQNNNKEKVIKIETDNNFRVADILQNEDEVKGITINIKEVEFAYNVNSKINKFLELLSDNGIKVIRKA
ncbi:MAG: ABC transporter ATP-binding protein [Clostridiales bacterium]